MPTSYPSSSSGLSRFFFPTKFFGLLLNCFTSVFRKYRPVSKISLWRRSAQAFSCLDQSNLEPWAPREERPILSWQPLFQSRWRSNHVFPLQRSPNWHCIPLAVSRIQQLLQYLEHNSNNLIHRTGKQISEISWPPLFWPRETHWQESRKNFSPQKASRRIGKVEKDRISSPSHSKAATTPPWPAFAYSQQLLLAGIMHVKPKDHHDPDVSGYRFKKVGRPTCEPRQMGLTDTGGLLD